MNILVIYHYPMYPCRTAITDHIYCFARYSGHAVFHLNTAKPGVPAHIRRRNWDAVIFHNTFLLERVVPERFLRLRRRLAFLIDRSESRIALPQDETSHTNGLIEFIRKFRITSVFTVAPRPEWRKLYGELLDNGPSFHLGLTGYLDERTLARVRNLRERLASDRIDIGYRSFKATARLGRLGALKWRIAEEVQRRAAHHRLTCDISTEASQVLIGDDWFRFLLSCRYQLGTESGASVLDPDGSIRECCRRYETATPEAEFEEVEAACFPGVDGNIRYAAVGPRHLEACATHSCQILIEGEYNGILKPDLHYIPVKADFSDLDTVLESLEDEDRRRRMVDRAYRDIVASGQYSYREYVKAVLGSVGIVPAEDARTFFLIFPIVYWNRLHEWTAWRYVQLRPAATKLYRALRTYKSACSRLPKRLSSRVLRNISTVKAALRSARFGRQR